MAEAVAKGKITSAGGGPDDYLKARHVEEQIVALLRDLRDMPRHEPVVTEHALAVTAEVGRAPVESLIEREARPLRLDQLVDAVVAVRIHGFQCLCSRFQSFRISRAALCPGIPDTPPPGCVEAPH